MPSRSMDVPWQSWRPTIRVAAVVLPVLSCALMSTMRELVTGEIAVLVLVLWVVVAAATGDRLAAVLAAISSGASYDYFLTEPFYQLTINDRQDIVATVLLVGISLVVTEVALWGSRQQADASRRSGYLDGVVDVAQRVARSDSGPGHATELVAQEITAVLGADTTRFVPGAVHDRRNAILHHDGTVARGDHVIDTGRSGLPSDEYTVIPVTHDGVVVGHFLVTAATRTAFPSREQLRVAVLLAEQVGGPAARMGS